MITLYINEDANGLVFVSKKPMNQTFYCTPARIRCIETNSKRITHRGVFVGAVCITIDNEIFKIVKVKNRQGYERSYIQEGSIKK